MSSISRYPPDCKTSLARESATISLIVPAERYFSSSEALFNIISSCRAFNFLIARYLSKSYKVHSKFKKVTTISLYVDERNVATKAKFTLERLVLRFSGNNHPKRILIPRESAYSMRLRSRSAFDGDVFTDQLLR